MAEKKQSTRLKKVVAMIPYIFYGEPLVRWHTILATDGMAARSKVSKWLGDRRWVATNLCSDPDITREEIEAYVMVGEVEFAVVASLVKAKGIPVARPRHAGSLPRRHQRGRASAPKLAQVAEPSRTTA